MGPCGSQDTWQELSGSGAAPTPEGAVQATLVGLFGAEMLHYMEVMAAPGFELGSLRKPQLPGLGGIL